MNVVKQLYQLQEIDLEIEYNEPALEQVTSQLGDSRAMTQMRGKLALEQQRLEELKQQQHATEWELDDLMVKLTSTEGQLYGGRVTSPKELTSLQHEAEGLKANRSQLENRALEIMDQIEQATASVASISSELKTLEADWLSQQQQLSSEMEHLQTILSNLRQKRQLLAAEIDPGVIEVYKSLKTQKRTPVARVEQGICRGCQISLSTTELQRARGGILLRCTSCGRILFLA